MKRSDMKHGLALALLSLAFAPCCAVAQNAAPEVRIEDALACKLAVPDYNHFAMNLDDDDTGYKALGWAKQDSASPMVNQYDLPQPITIDGHTTSTLVFSSGGLAAVLDDPDTLGVARGAGLANTVPSHEELARMLKLTPAQAAQFPDNHIVKAQKVLVDKTGADPDPKLGKVHTRVVRLIENNADLPGKTLDGCSYSMDFPDL